MIIDNNNGYVEIKADENKVLKIGNKTFKIGAFPFDYDVSQIEEVEVLPTEGEE